MHGVRRLPDRLPVVETCRVLVPEAPKHGKIITRCVTIVNSAERSCEPNAGLRLSPTSRSGRAGLIFGPVTDHVLRLQAALGNAYRVERELGGGGMSQVFVAVEVGLGRRVVVKVLPPELAAGVNAERFQREMQLAASLQHPLIVPLLTAGRAADLVYYTMPLIDGESLRAKLAREGELPVPEGIRILRDVADALSYAHRHDVVHRDIKPDNVLLASHHALVTDFGVAKALSASTGQPSEPSSLTSAGVALGTPAYMAPEQAAADPRADYRCDIYALGALGYEMLTGRPPFTGPTPQQVLAAQVTEAPESVAKRRATVPPPLADLIMRCLEKSPADRWQSADELRAELEAMTTPSEGQPARPRAPHLWFPGVGRRVALGAVALVGLAGAWFVWRGRTPASAPVSASRVAVLPFSIHGGGDIAYLGEGMVNLLGASLDGASDLHSVDPRALLAAVTRAGARSLDPTVGGTVARGLGAGLYVTGDVVQAGERLRIEASLYDARRGAEPAARGTVEGATTQIFGLVDELAAQLVANRSEGPGARVTRIAAVTTASLPALKAYLEGDRRFRAQQFAEALDAFQRAAAIDTLFALAYYRLSITAEWLVRGDLARDAAEQAVRHSDRLSDHDRALLEALLATRRGDADAAERLYRTIVGLYPDDVEAWFQLGEVRFHYGPRERGRSIGESQEAWERVLQLEPGNAGAALHLARVAAVQGKRQELDSLVRLVITLSPQGERVVEMQVLRAAVLGDSAVVAEALGQLRRASDLSLPLVASNAVVYGGNYARAAEFVRVLTEPGRSAEVRALGHVYLAHLAAAFGRWRAADRELAAADSLDHASALEYRALFAALPFRPTPAAELERMRRRLVAWDAAAVPPSRLPSLFFTANNGVHRHIRAYLLGLLSARLQDAGAAERYAIEVERLGGPPDVQAWGRDLAQDVRAAAAAARGDARRTLDALSRATFNSWYILAIGSPFYLPPLERYRRAEALALLGPSTEALGWYHSFADYSLFAILYVAPGYLRSAELYERLGQPAKAAEQYARFVQLWSDCDPELAPEVARARVALARVQGAPPR